MFEKLDKLRAEVERRKKKIEEDKLKLKQAEENLQNAENEQILADVGALNLKPEQLSEFLKLLAGGKVSIPGAAGDYEADEAKSAYTADDDETENEDETEDFDDEEN